MSCSFARVFMCMSVLCVMYCVMVSGLLLHALCVAVEFCVLWLVG